ncbi:MAG TPA: hypothetical protein ENI92_04090, partial [Bacteroidetes bacterium]|nr:hypothetical protein [Bacteroidota bacterium]
MKHEAGNILSRAGLLLTGVLLLFLPCAPSTGGTAFGEEPIPLAALVDSALAHNPDLGAAREGILEAETSIRQARSALWPAANLSGSYTRPSYVPTVEFPGGPGGSMQTIRFTAENQLNAQLQTTYPFFTWGRTKAGVELARLGVENARDAAEQAARALTLAVTRVYFGLALAHESL